MDGDSEKEESSRAYEKFQKDPDYLNTVSNKIKLTDFILSLGTGDLIFSRSDTVTGHLIQFSGHCIWNHVAVCISTMNESNGPYWCEATNTVYENDELARGGVKIWNIKDRFDEMFKKEPDTFFIFGVSYLKKKEPSKKEEQKLVSFLKKEKGKPYQDAYSVLFFSWFDGFSSIKNTCCCYSTQAVRDDMDKQPLYAINKNDTSKYFCSELVAEALVQSGIMKMKKNGKILPSSEWDVAKLADTVLLNNNLNNNFYYTEIVFYYVYA